MNKTFILLIIILSISLVIFGGIFFFERDSISFPFQESRETLSYCVENQQGEFCCDETWIGDRLLERECKQVEN